MNDPAQRLGIAELVARVDATHPDLGEVPVDLAQRLDTLQPNWRRIIELFREDAAVSDADRRLHDLETRLAAVESHLTDVAIATGVPRRKAPKSTKYRSMIDGCLRPGLVCRSG